MCMWYNIKNQEKMYKCFRNYNNSFMADQSVKNNATDTICVGLTAMSAQIKKMADYEMTGC